MEKEIILPSKPRVVLEEVEKNKGVYEIDGLYPGYGNTLGNSLRRIILSSLPGAAITTLKIEGASHEFSTLSGIKEDVINILLNLKNVRFRLHGDESIKVSLTKKGIGAVTAADIEVPTQVEVLNKDQYIASITDKTAELKIEITIEKGLGYVQKEELQKDKLEIGTLAVDAAFTPIRRANYEVENMRVGDRTDYNRLRLIIETDGSVSPREAMEHSIATMIKQLSAITGFKETEVVVEEQPVVVATEEHKEESREDKNREVEVMKTRVDELDLSTRTMTSLSESGIRTVGGLARKSEDDLLNLPGLGDKGVIEIKRVLGNFGITLKS
ncbi:MAG: DNA-directed RNA polymerase subunit alpha [bacterium]|nr:DNA-directed RNA polymerase subunit alpha [bacterium]